MVLLVEVDCVVEVLELVVVEEVLVDCVMLVLEEVVVEEVDVL